MAGSDSGAQLGDLDPKDKQAAQALRTSAGRIHELAIIAPLQEPEDDRHPTKPHGTDHWQAIALETHSVINVGGIA